MFTDLQLPCLDVRGRRLKNRRAFVVQRYRKYVQKGEECISGWEVEILPAPVESCDTPLVYEGWREYS